MGRIYYSHAMCTHDTLTERQELAIVRKIFPTHEVVDPGDYQDNLEREIRGMDYCLELVESCDALIFSRIPDRVTAGVGKEVEHALSLGKAVYELVGGNARMIRDPPRLVSREETRDLYVEWNNRNL